MFIYKMQTKASVKISTAHTSTKTACIKKPLHLCRNLDQISEELMEDMDTYMCDSEETKQKDPYNTDPLWEPEQLRREYENTADDDDNLTRNR